MLKLNLAIIMLEFHDVISVVTLLYFVSRISISIFFCNLHVMNCVHVSAQCVHTDCS